MTTGALQAVQIFLADGGDSPSDVDPTTGKGPEWGEAAPIGLLVIVLMCVAVYFLVKSLNRNLKKVPKSFDPEPVLVGAVGAEESGAAAAPGLPAPSVGDPTATGVRSAGSAGVTADPGPDRAAEPPSPSSA